MKTFYYLVRTNNQLKVKSVIMNIKDYEKYSLICVPYQEPQYSYLIEIKAPNIKKGKELLEKTLKIFKSENDNEITLIELKEKRSKNEKY